MENRHTKFFFFVVTSITLSIQLHAQQSLFTRTEKPGLVPDKFDSAVTAKFSVLINIPLLTSADNTLLTVLLPDTTQITIRKKRVETDKNQVLNWYGEINEQRGSLVTFAIKNNILAGTIRNNKGIVYRISYRGDGVYRVFKIDPSLIAPELPRSHPPPPDDTSQFEEPYCTDSPRMIGVMVVYTAETLTGFVNVNDLELEVTNWIMEANISYGNSDILQQLQLTLPLRQTSYQESTMNTELILGNLISKTDMILNDVHTWRDMNVADVVVLLVNRSVLPGLSTVMANVSGAFESHAFSVVKWTHAGSPTYTFAHELGHLMGARHDCARVQQESEPSDPNLPFCFAHAIYGDDWGTMMTPYDPDKPRILYWSNLIYNYDGQALGSTNPNCSAGNATATDCAADNATVLNTTASVVSKFRCSAPLITNVWMRDTWEDTGREPDPNTVGQLMCMSPYIWVRNLRDVGFVHQHDHQNPVAGAPNFIYVKLHNGGPTIGGNLEVYIGSASTSLQWPNQWTLVATKSITLNSLTTSIIEFNWNTQSDRGHYCLLARWVAAADPMASVETADINVNTRQNNNIIWRNMNIADLSITGLISTVFEVERNTEDAMLLEFSDSAIFPHEPFYKKGRLDIILDPLTYHAWKQGGSVYSGLKRNGRRFRVTSPNAFIANIMLTPKYKGKIKVEFQKKKETEKDKYFFVAAQYEQAPIKKATEKKANRKLIGAVGYEIYTYKRKALAL